MTTSEANFHRATAQSQNPLQETNIQGEGSQRGSISTPSGLRNVEQQNSDPVVSQGSGVFNFLKNLFSRTSGGSSASAAQAPEAVLTPPKKAQSEFIMALEALVALDDSQFPKNPKELGSITSKCQPREADAINNALANAEKVYIAQHCDKNDEDEPVQKQDAPSIYEFYKSKLQELLDTAKASEAEEVSLPVNKKPNAFQRTKEANLYIGTYNQAIESFIRQLNGVQSQADLTGVNEVDRQIIENTVETYKGEGDDKVIEKLRGLKREDQSIFEKSNKYVARLFAKPLVDFGKPDFVSLRGGSFLGKVKHFATGYVFHNISELAKKSITNNAFSQRLEEFVQDTSHSLKLRILASGVAGTLGVLNVVGVALKTLGIIALAATLQFTASTLTVAAVLAIPTALIGLCVLNPYIGIPVLFGVCVLALILNQIYLTKQMNGLKEENKRILQLLEQRNNVSPESSVHSSRLGLRGLSEDNGDGISVHSSRLGLRGLSEAVHSEEYDAELLDQQNGDANQQLL